MATSFNDEIWNFNDLQTLNVEWIIIYNLGD